MLNLIRNFSIIAHVDHGKSTLADRILEACRAVSPAKMKEQFLDKLELERERGITIKAQAVCLNYKYGCDTYILNLIDTPGHVDFSYEVSRSLAACEGAILLVDATQGVEAQTVANAYLAIENGLEIIPVINKIDLPNADPERCLDEMSNILGLPKDPHFLTSGKTGEGVIKLIEEGIIKLIPWPQGKNSGSLKALVFDSWYDQYLGVVLQIRVFEGSIKTNDRIAFYHSQKIFDVTHLGVFDPFPRKIEVLSAGMVGHIACGIKDIREIKIGDTLCHANDLHNLEPISGFKEIKPKVFGGFYPGDENDFEDLKRALEKLSLNDSAITYQPESSLALGIGFRCGFLGLLHMEIVKERLNREFGVDPVVTTPNVSYLVTLTNGEQIVVENPGLLPDPSKIREILEPVCVVTIHTPIDYLGQMLEICEKKRGIQKKLQVYGSKAVLEYEIPMSEIVVDFHDKVKACSKGYASFDYEFSHYKPDDIVKVDIRINGKSIDALSFLIHRSKAYEFSRNVVEKLRTHIERELFEINIQACIGSRVIASSKVPPLRKNVTAKCYGGDITRKKKLLERQKEGKKRMKMLGSVEVKPEVFLKIVKEI
ncbi:MAG: translation elongation factor 4 [Deltaproteobacteria bacterium]|nr:translation elongation factor 4 [Deltaproteobacteria bacterium]MCX7953517.1 translation elongation factor 4 [Deltaproteobacteria bacterium]